MFVLLPFLCVLFRSERQIHLFPSIRHLVEVFVFNHNGTIFEQNGVLLLFLT